MHHSPFPPATQIFCLETPEACPLRCCYHYNISVMCVRGNQHTFRTTQQVLNCDMDHILRVLRAFVRSCLVWWCVCELLLCLCHAHFVCSTLQEKPRAALMRASVTVLGRELRLSPRRLALPGCVPAWAARATPRLLTSSRRSSGSTVRWFLNRLRQLKSIHGGRAAANRCCDRHWHAGVFIQLCSICGHALDSRLCSSSGQQTSFCFCTGRTYHLCIDMLLMCNISWNRHVYIYIYIYIYFYTCFHLCTYKHTCTKMYIHINMYTHTCIPYIYDEASIS